MFKPAGWRVHPAGPVELTDLTVWLEGQRDLPAGLAPAHRIDRGTSGIVLCGTTPDVRRQLGLFFEASEMRKTYLCLVHGIIRKKGILRKPLEDGRRGRPLEAVTRYRCLEHFQRWSLVEASPVTGRKHQIRRHLQGVGHSIIGDDRYGPRRRKSVPHFPGRLWLHAQRLETPDGFEVECPLPEELATHLEQLRSQPA